MDAVDGSSHPPGHPRTTLADLVAEATGTSPLNCYQCGRCAAGCAQNVAGEMGLSPTRIMRLIQLESAFIAEPDQAKAYASRALGSDTCWLCAGCLACTTCCPQGVDIAGTMDVLREQGLQRGLASQSRRARDIQAFHKVFLEQAVKHGRVHELFMVLGFKLRTGHLLADAKLGPAMFSKGKLHVLPGKSIGTGRVRAAIKKLKKTPLPHE